MEVIAQPQNVIALISDLDLTLTPEYTQGPLLKYYNIDEKEFWDDVKRRYAKERAERLKQLEEEEKRFPEHLRVPVSQERADYTEELVYASVILEYVRKGRLKGLSRRLLRELGKEIQFFPGVPEFVPELKEWVGKNPEWKKHDIKLEFYIASAAIADMIRGSGIMPYCEGIFATEFGTGDADKINGEIDRIDCGVSYTEKTKFIHRINKGWDVDVNDLVPKHMRRVRGDCMFFIGDGPTDVPCMSAINRFGGKCIGIYGRFGDEEKDKKAFDNAFGLRDQGRVINFSEANYTKDSQTRRTLQHLIEEAAYRIAGDRERAISLYSGKSPGF